MVRRGGEKSWALGSDSQKRGNVSVVTIGFDDCTRRPGAGISLPRIVDCQSRVSFPPITLREVSLAKTPKRWFDGPIAFVQGRLRTLGKTMVGLPESCHRLPPNRRKVDAGDAALMPRPSNSPRRASCSVRQAFSWQGGLYFTFPDPAPASFFFHGSPLELFLQPTVFMSHGLGLIREGFGLSHKPRYFFFRELQLSRLPRSTSKRRVTANRRSCLEATT